MHYVTDLHLHSKYSRAVSPQMTLPVMAELALQKGLDILSASDFTHPVWFGEIREQLVEAEEGLYTLREAESYKSHPSYTTYGTDRTKKVRFLLSTEISCIYKQGEKVRRVHNLVFVPSFEVAEKFNAELVRRGCNLKADGRPIIGLTSKQLLEVLLEIDDRSYLIPAHIWTPHFGIYGSASGFDSLEEAFGELAPQIFGIETGLSSDPDMNWQTRELMNRSILSFSDAHSAPKMAREATVVDLEEVSFLAIRHAFERLSKPELGEKNKIAYTLEFYPEEGKYHFSGHRDHKVVFGPDEIRKQGNICPVCKRRLTEGVLYRVQQLSDKKLLHRTKEAFTPEGVKQYTDSLRIQPPYVKLIPLLEIAAESLGSTVNSKKSQNLFAKLCSELTSELHVLLRAPISDIEKVGGETVAQAIKKVRTGDIAIDPGYDGVFGKVQIWTEEEEKELHKKSKSQLGLNF